MVHNARLILAAAVFAFALPAFSETSINNYLCHGMKLGQDGAELGEGATLIVLLDDGTLRLIDKDDSNNPVIEMNIGGYDQSGTAFVYKTPSDEAGIGLGIHKSNIEIALGKQLFIYTFAYSAGKITSQYQLDCTVTSSEAL